MTHRFALAALSSMLGPIGFCGCQAEFKTRDWSNYEGPGAEYFQREEVEFPHVPDLLEPFNRTVFHLNNGLMLGVVRPIGRTYDFLTPSFVATGVSNFFENLLYPGRLVNNLMQGNLGGAWDETRRFAVNTSVGVLGLWDRASDMEIEASDEDFGQTFAVWGWSESTYLMIPFLGPSTVRDGLGRIGDSVVDPAVYHSPAPVVRSVHSATRVVDAYREFVTTNFDPYELGRLLYVYYRDLQINDFEYGLVSDDSGVVESLGSLSLRHEDPEFPGRGETHRVLSPASGKPVTYTVWVHDEAADVIYCLPGTGAHRMSGGTLAIAEEVYGSGRIAVTLGSTLNFEFIEGGLSSALPGHIPSDARDVHVALEAIDRDLHRRYPDLLGERRGLVGLSLGGMHVLSIAAAENDPENSGIEFDTYVALSAPVQLEHAVKTLDRFYNTGLRIPEVYRTPWMMGVLRKILDLAEGSLVPTSAELPFTRMEAEFLIGLSFRNTIRDVIYQTQEQDDMGVLMTRRSNSNRSSAHREILQFSFMEYLYAFLLPRHADARQEISYSDEGGQMLIDECDLRSIEEGLRQHPKVYYVGSANDFMLTPEDIDWVRATLVEDQVKFFERGGHTGNLFIEDIQDSIRRFVTPNFSDGDAPTTAERPDLEESVEERP